MNEKKTTWVEIRPGVYTHQVPMEKRKVNKRFVREVAEAIDVPSVRKLILKTGEK